MSFAIGLHTLITLEVFLFLHMCVICMFACVCPHESKCQRASLVAVPQEPFTVLFFETRSHPGQELLIG